MAPYTNDRSFTDFVHTHLAIPKIYTPLGWKEYEMNPDTLKRIDMNRGIDYVFTDSAKKKIYIQERFRTSRYRQYGDATLRYERKHNSHPERVQSEYYKIKADYLVYGITNGDKTSGDRDQLSDFLKWVILDLHFIRDRYKEGKIVIVDSAKKTCWIDDSILKCPENFNPDGSSSFIPFDIKMLTELWAKSPVVAQKGFL